MQTTDPEQRRPNGRRVRSDALPEHVEYRDTGCELAPSCVRCPLVRCRYDEPGGARKLLLGSRDETLRRRRREDGVAIEALAVEFGLSRRSVFRILAGDALDEAIDHPCHAPLGARARPS
jgi:hypothetical protein